MIENKQHGAQVFVDFENSRKRSRTHKGAPLLRSVAVKGLKMSNVIDTTAGLGGDSFVIAGSGHKVLMVERNPVFFALLRDGLERAQVSRCIETQETAHRMRLIHGDSVAILRGLRGSHEDESWDVAYVDPMYPEEARKRSALPKAGILTLTLTLTLTLSP